MVVCENLLYTYELFHSAWVKDLGSLSGITRKSAHSLVEPPAMD